MRTTATPWRTADADLADARSRGIVKIEIPPEKFCIQTIAKALREHCNPDDRVVIPTDADERSLIARLGDAGPQVLRRPLRSGETLAVTCGRTVLSLANQIVLPGLSDVRVVQATAGSTTKIR